ncbi:MAG: folate-binding protein [Burkholderiaceae bacterium]
MTSNFLTLANHAAQLAGFCSAKGRLQASFIAVKRDETDILLIGAADLLSATLKRLSMFVLRLKCRLSDASADLPVYGLAGTSADELLLNGSVWVCRDSADGMALRLPDAAGHRFGLWLPQLHIAVPAHNAPELTQDEWRWLLLSCGIPLIEAKTVDLFVPQMVNFELLGGVDFKKGCYPGQEVVARSQYRGTLKRRMFLFDCDVQASAGQEVFSSADPSQPAGVVANAAPHPGRSGCTALVEVKLAELEHGTLHLGQPDGPPLVRRELPYEVGAESREVD